MRAIYIECNMGVAGDMLSSALWGIIDNKEKLKKQIDALNIPNTKIDFQNKTINGISGYISQVRVNGVEEGESHHNHHRSINSINSIINSLNASDDIKSRIKSIYKIIADAESKVHNTDVELVHFHEVGALDAVADVAVCALLLKEIGADVIISSPINVGNGTVKCQHGILSVPAPATTEILKNIPYYKSNEIDSELCTPTGAAILKGYSHYFGKMPTIRVEKVSCGFGKKVFENYQNCVRVFYGEIYNDNSVCELICNIDDMTAEEISYALRLFLKNGALDASAESLEMKKGRLGYIIRVLCKFEDKLKFVKLILNNTSTIGIRECLCERTILDRKIVTIDTDYGKIRVKISSGFEIEKHKIEYDDIARIADENGISFFEAEKILEKYVENCFTQQ